MNLNSALALANVCLSTASAVCAVGAVRAIRRKRVRSHRNLMLAAVVASALFMMSFVLRFVWFGSKPFHGHGVLRGVYLAVFFSHEPIAVISVPLVLTALGLGLARSVAAHREVATIAYPVWLYSLVTGVIIYVFLYLLPGQ